MTKKTIEISTLSLDYIVESLGIQDTEMLLNVIEDLSEAISLLSSSDECKAGIVSSVAYSQQVLIDLLRLKNNK